MKIMLEGANFMAPADALYSPNNYSKSLVTSTFHLTKLSHIETMSELQWILGNGSKMDLFISNGSVLVKQPLLSQTMLHYTIKMVCSF